MSGSDINVNDKKGDRQGGTGRRDRGTYSSSYHQNVDRQTRILEGCNDRQGPEKPLSPHDLKTTQGTNDGIAGAEKGHTLIKAGVSVAL